MKADEAPNTIVRTTWYGWDILPVSEETMPDGSVWATAADGDRYMVIGPHDAALAPR